MRQYPRGSEWRKWDLHVHTPSRYTLAKNDQYRGSGLDEKLQNFISDIESINDVSVLGITDYFSLEGYKNVLQHKNRLENFDLILPNIELRITPVTNDDRKINIHIIPNTLELSLDEVERFLHGFTFDHSNQYTCTYDDLVKMGKKQGGEAQSDEEAFKKGLDNFSISYDKFIEKFDQQPIKFKNNILIGVSNSSNDGVSGIKDEPIIRNLIYKAIDFIFSSNQKDREYFLGKGTDEEKTICETYGRLKPCLHGSDFHGTESGAQVLIPNENRFCWIKADPTFEGLKQVVYEPEERVRIQETSPGEKPLDRVISKIQFNHASSILPQEITFNENLCSIIGSRSSGKSSLLAYLAYGINNEETKQKIGGPAPAIKWNDLYFDITVIWKSGDSQENVKMTYIPQNFLYEYCQDNNKISSLIRDTIFYDTACELQKKYDNVKEIIEKSNRLIEKDIDKYIKNIQNIQYNKELMKNEGNQETLDKVIKEKEQEKSRIEEKSGLSDEDKEDIKTYQEKKQELEQKDEELNKIYQQISQFIHDDESVNFDINIYTNPNIDKLPQDIYSPISEFIDKNRSDVLQHVQESIMNNYQGIKKKKNDNQNKKNQLTEDYKKIIEKIKSLQSLEKINQELYDSKTRLQKIKSYQQTINNYENNKQDIITDIKNKINDKHEILNKFKESSMPSKQGVQFSIEIEYSDEQYNELTQLFNLGITNQYIDENKRVKLPELLENLHDFLNTMYSEDNSTQILKKNVEKNDAIKKILTTDKEIRFVGEVEETRIGGFQESSMTDGEKALFALRLLLDDSSGAWPLLIDQPEDDLDSRSIYDEIVPFLKEQKQKRQIIMVSHNANLVVGSDSEQVIVANKHSSSKPNKDEQTLDYLTGSLEMSQVEDSSQDEYLKGRGIREHTCHILDGGAEAFNKRKKKYNIS